MPNVHEDEHLENLRRAMEKTGVGMAPALRTHVQAALEYGVQLVRVEYEELAQHNLDLLQKYSRRTKTLLAALAAMLLVLGLLSVHLSGQGLELEHKTCTIQNNGLKAGPHLVAAMQDIGYLIIPRPGQKSVSEPLHHILAHLSGELKAYVVVEHELPLGRSC